MKNVDLETELKKEKGNKTEQIRLVLSLSLPAILAQLTSIAMQYIDAGMVGSMGANATAAIGLVSTSTWLVGGTCIGLSAGFYVQIAQLIGAGKNDRASNVYRQGLKTVVLLGLIICIFGACISGYLPGWLGGQENICKDASVYFKIYCYSIPFTLIRQLSAGTMQASGDMKTPSILSATVCILDVIFNLFLIFPTRTVAIWRFVFTMPGVNLGVTGAALGTALADLTVSMLMLGAVVFKNKKMSLVKNKGSWRYEKQVLVNAVKIAVPMSLDQFFMCSAYVAGTFIVAPIGTIAVAANSLAVTAESLCYMPGYGIGSAATAIIGQTIGAKRNDLTKSFSKVCVYLGMALMGLMAVFMYFFAPTAFSLLTSDYEVASLGTKVLRMELLAEPLYAASIVCAGVFRGAGDTLKPSIMNLVSMWGVRILLAWIMVPKIGLMGYWLAMTIELCFRGLVFLIRLLRGKWIKKSMAE